ncbi:MAG TPA: hypothetical protein PK022_06275, partial [Syntrophales bacterium]|nr:hypothetical protein [Syntrophales bacterium]
MHSPRLRAFFLFFLVLTFAVLIFGGYLINRDKPPIPQKIVRDDDKTIITLEDIFNGRNYYFSR